MMIMRNLWRLAGWLLWSHLHTISCAHIYGHKPHFIDFSYAEAADHEYRYVVEGDLTIGAMFPIHNRGGSGQACGTELREEGVVQYVEALLYAIQQINDDPGILPGYSLGTVVLDDCGTAETALGQALHFMPLHQHSGPCLDRDGDGDGDGDCEGGIDPHDHQFTFYDVVGVIGSESSDASMMIANVLGLFNVPQISVWATSDLLSDKAKYPYFMRTVPPDRFQVEAILQLIRHFNWTYISAVYSKGGYGEEAFNQLQYLLEDEPSICMGNTISVRPDDEAAVYNKAIQTLYTSKVLVVVLLTDQEEARGLLQAAKHANLGGHFVWIGSDGLGVNLDDFDGLEDIALGSLVLLSYSVPVAGFQSHFEQLQPGKTSNPWFNEMWQDLFECYPQIGENFEDICPMDKTILDTNYTPEAYVSTIIDTVSVFALALDQLIKDHCPGIPDKHVRSCIKGDILIDYLHNITVSGHNGIISFDENGDMLGKYEIQNFQAGKNGYGSKGVGFWDSSTRQLHINESDIIWNVRRSSKNTVPRSQCGETCGVGQIYSYFRDTCCWECRTCSANQISAVNATKCLPCPQFTWPDANKTHCVELVPNFVQWDSIAAIVFIIISILGVASCSMVFGVFIRHNDNRLIKATSRELSYLLLIGVTLQYSLLVSIVAMPTNFVCYYNYVGFNVSFSIVYAPLLTRTNRIFRIFESGRRTKLSPSFTSPTSQIIIAGGLIIIQLIINVIVLISSPPSPTLRMPISSRPSVELTCALPVQGFITSLAYNLLLVAMCTYYAFRTRTLPDNFNESRYITLCVYTTLIIWLAFLPSYFTNNYAFYQSILLSCALVLSATVILLCLFLPKVYAVLTMVSEVPTESCSTQTTGLGFKYNATRFSTSNTGRELYKVDDDNTEMTEFISIPRNGSTVSAPTNLNGCST